MPLLIFFIFGSLSVQKITRAGHDVKTFNFCKNRAGILIWQPEVASFPHNFVYMVDFEQGRWV